MAVTIIPVEHPGIVLKDEFLEPYGITIETLAEKTSVSEQRLRKMIAAAQPFSFDIALKIAKFFGLSERYFINLQTEYDFRIAKQNLKDELSRITPMKLSA